VLDDPIILATTNKKSFHIQNIK